MVMKTNAPDKIDATIQAIKAGEWCPHVLHREELSLLALVAASGIASDWDISLIKSADKWAQGAARNLKASCVCCETPFSRDSTGGALVGAIAIGHVRAWSTDPFESPLMCAGLCMECAQNYSPRHIGDKLKAKVLDSVEKGQVKRLDPEPDLPPPPPSTRTLQ